MATVLVEMVLALVGLVSSMDLEYSCVEYCGKTWTSLHHNNAYHMMKIYLSNFPVLVNHVNELENGFFVDITVELKLTTGQTRNRHSTDDSIFKHESPMNHDSHDACGLHSK